MPSYTIEQTTQGFALHANGKPVQTAAKKTFVLDSLPLMEAVQSEWQSQPRFSAEKMPLSAMAFTAIDRIAGQEELTVEALLIYLDTDTLSYEAEDKTVRARQQEAWQPLRDWAEKTYGAHWQTTSGVMPIEQPEALHAAIRARLTHLDALHLAPVAILASLYASLLLALAVLERYLGADDAFFLSRLEEELQAERWGRDEEAARRTEIMRKEVQLAGEFLKLLDERRIHH